MQVEPHIPDELTNVRRRMILNVKEQLEAIVGYFEVSGNAIYAMNEVSDPISLQSTHDNEEYTLKILFLRNLTYLGEDYENSVGVIQIFNSTIKKVMRNTGFVQPTMLPRMFDKEQIVSVDQYQMEVWKGFAVTVKPWGPQLMLEVATMSRMIRKDSVLDYINEIMRNPRGKQPRDAVNQALVERSCMARYGNNRIYKIVRVEWNETVNSTFYNSRQDRDMTFREYYMAPPYNLRITNETQPLLVFQMRQQKEMIEGKLIPELCSMTGLEDSMRADFNIMRELTSHTILPPEQNFDK